MNEFFKGLDKTGFVDTGTVPPLNVTIDKESARRSLNNALPSRYLNVINKFSDHKRQQILFDIAHNINLFIKTKFNDTQLSSLWEQAGLLPQSYHGGLRSVRLSELARKFEKTLSQIESAQARVMELEKIRKDKKKLTKRQTDSLDKNNEKLISNRNSIKSLEDEFFYAMKDFESSLGAIY